MINKPMGESEGEIHPFSAAAAGVSMPKSHKPAFFLHISWPLLIMCCIIKEHSDLGFFKEKNNVLYARQTDGRKGL